MLRLLVLAACLPSLARAQPCELEGTLSLDDLKVAVAGDSFRVRIRNASVRVQPTRDDARVEVDASLRFTASTSEMPWFIRTRVETEHGMLSLTPSVRIDHVRGASDELTAVVHLNPWVHIRRVRLPCGAVVIERDRIEEPPPLERGDLDGDGRLFRPRRSVLSIHSTPNADSPRIRARLERDAPFMLSRIGRYGAWYRVEWTDGSSRIRGWVRRTDVRPSERHGWGSTGGTGTPGCMPRGRASIHGGYEGPAEIAEGTEVLHPERSTVGNGGHGTLRRPLGPERHPRSDRRSQRNHGRHQLRNHPRLRPTRSRHPPPNDPPMKRTPVALHTFEPLRLYQRNK